MKHMLKCSTCGEYMLSEKCKCGGRAALPKPAKYSPEDSYGTYRRKAKEALFKKRDLI